MRKLLITLGLALLAAVTAKAQEGPNLEVSGGYMYIRANPGQGIPAQNCQGGNGTAAVSLRAWFGVVGDFGGCKITGLPAGTSSHAINYLFGPRVSFHSYGRVTPYAQVLFGGERFSANATGVGSASSNAFAMTFGGGADFRMTRHISVRPIQVEYLYTHFSGAKQNNMRIESSLVYRFR